ncbi:MAG: S1C family serine protease [Spirochaetales bacterium]|nr:S1C family serine protease [Spirochaetales bacterium]
MRQLCWSIVLLILPLLSLQAKNPSITELEPGVLVEGQLYPQGEGIRSYRFQLPVTISTLSIELFQAEADLDLILRPESSNEENPLEFRFESDEWNEKLRLCKTLENQMPAGRYVLDVRYAFSQAPRRNGRKQSSIYYQLKMDWVDGLQAEPLHFQEIQNITLDSENLHTRVFQIDPPPSIEGFRIDVLDTPGDVDLFLSRSHPAPEREGYQVISESLLGRESLLVFPDELQESSYFLTVMENTNQGRSIPVRLALFEGNAVPSEYPQPPILPEYPEGYEKIRLSTVQLISEAGIGSGCFVSSKGSIVTNAHVAFNSSSQIVDSLIVALSLSPYEEPVELFTAKVEQISRQDDLALLQITGDRWGRPLPSDYRFFYWPIDFSHSFHLGDPLQMFGFPWMGSGLSRSHFTITSGILSGGELTSDGMIWKTDAEISGGSSGGAVSDEQGKLLGFPTFVVSQDSAQLSYFVPVDRIPRDWRDFMDCE